MKQGGIEITPATIEGMNSLLKIGNYDKKIFGENVYPHLAGVKNQRPWLCVNKVPYTTDVDDQQTINNIKHQLTQIHINIIGENIHIEGIHRIRNNKNPTNLKLFKTKNDIHQHILTNTKVNINNIKHNIRIYIDKKVAQCSKCKRLGHLKPECRNNYVCGRCGSENCPPGNCKKPDGPKKCINCKQSHSSTYKGCPKLKTAQKEQFTRTKLHNMQQQHINYTKTRLSNNSKENTNKIQELNNKYTTDIEQLRQELQLLKQDLQKQDMTGQNMTHTNTEHLQHELLELKENIHRQNTENDQLRQEVHLLRNELKRQQDINAKQKEHNNITQAIIEHMKDKTKHINENLVQNLCDYDHRIDDSYTVITVLHEELIQHKRTGNIHNNNTPA